MNEKIINMITEEIEEQLLLKSFVPKNFFFKLSKRETGLSSIGASPRSINVQFKYNNKKIDIGEIYRPRICMKFE